MLKAQDSKPECVELLSVCLKVWTGNQTCLNYCKLMNITCILNHNKWPYLYNSGTDWGGLVGFWHFLYLCYFAACGLASLCGTVRWLKSKTTLEKEVGDLYSPAQPPTRFAAWCPTAAETQQKGRFTWELRWRDIFAQRYVCESMASAHYNNVWKIHWLKVYGLQKVHVTKWFQAGLVLTLHLQQAEKMNALLPFGWGIVTS